MYRSLLCRWKLQKKYWIKGGTYLCSSNFSPNFQFFFFNESLFGIIQWKIKKDNVADWFSQPSLLIFTKSANNSDCMGHIWWSMRCNTEIIHSLCWFCYEAYDGSLISVTQSISPKNIHRTILAKVSHSGIFHLSFYEYEYSDVAYNLTYIFSHAAVYSRFTNI